MKERHVISVVLLSLFAIVLTVFWPTLHADFLHWDDDINVFENPHIQGLTGVNLSWMFTDFEQAIRYKALSWFAWAIVHELFGLNPFGYHLANVFLHTMNTWLVFFLCLWFLKEKTNMGIIAAGIAALLFGIHPLRVEPVAWVTGLPYHLSLLFLLSSVIFYLKADPQRAGFQQRHYWLAVLSYLLAVMTYPTVLGFCAVLIAIDLYPLRRFQREGRISFSDKDARRVWLEKIPFIVLASLTVAGTLYGRFFNVGTWFEAADAAQFTMAERIMQAFYVWAYYVWKPLWPTDLCPLYPTLLRFSPTDAVFVLSAIGVVGLSAFLILRRNRWPWTLALWFAHLGLLVPMLGLTERPHYPHDRYSIVNGVIWSVLFIGAIRQLGIARMKPLLTAGSIVAIMLGLLSFRQTAIWKNDITFFTHLSQKSGTPRLNAAAFMKLGNAYGNNGEDLFALKYYDEAWATDPQFPYVQLPYNHANALLRLGRASNAAENYERALKVDPEHLGALNNLGICLLNLKQPERAIALFQRAVEIEPSNANSLFNLGSALADNGNPDAALQLLQQSLNLSPMAVNTHRKLSEIYTARGQGKLAQQHTEAALQIEAAIEQAANAGVE